MTSPYVRQTLEKCEQSAMKFKRRVDWARDIEHGKFYQAAKYRGWLGKCCSHMNEYDEYNDTRQYCVYTLLFTGNRIYTGLTKNFYSRIHQHFSKRGKFSSLKAVYLGHKFIAQDILLPEARQLEKDLIAEFKLDGYTVLNESGGGEASVGKRLPFSVLQESALKFNSRTAWKRGTPGMYLRGRASGRMNELCAHMPKYTPSATTNARRKKAMLRVWKWRDQAERAKVLRGLVKPPTAQPR